MNLFDNNLITNLLPQDGTVNYYGKIMAHTQAQAYYEALLETTAWKNDEAIIFGKHIVTARKVAWYGDHTFAYTYSKITKQALLWTPTLIRLKTLVETISGTSYNSCLLNLYHSGQEGMGWHSDDEKTLQHHASIAALSFGAERKFAFKHKQNGQNVSLNLENGSLLVMKDATQSHWLHQLPKTTKVKTPRISLTFRSIVL